MNRNNGGSTPNGVLPTHYLAKFYQNYMNMKKIRPKDAFLAPFLDPPLQKTIKISQTQKQTGSPGSIIFLQNNT